MNTLNRLYKRWENFKMNIEMIKEFLEWAEHIPFLEVVEEPWSLVSGEVHWIEDDCEYSSETLGKPLRKDGIFIVNTDNGCGETITMVFLEEKEVK